MSTVCFQSTQTGIINIYSNKKLLSLLLKNQKQSKRITAAAEMLLDKITALVS